MVLRIPRDRDRAPPSHLSAGTGPIPVLLAAHYAAQLEQAGWTRTEEGRSGPQSWSAWTLTDEKGRPWTGTFTALALSGPPNRYLLQIHAGRATTE